MSPTAVDNGQEVESYYHPQQNGHYPHQSMTSMTSESHPRNSINHQDVVMAHELPYSKDMPDVEESGGMIHAANGSSSKYSLLQFAAQHFRNE